MGKIKNVYFVEFDPLMTCLRKFVIVPPLNFIGEFFIIFLKAFFLTKF